jgi:hypothetical protein
MENISKELSIDEQLNEFCEIIASIIFKQILREEEKSSTQEITLIHQNFDKYP